MTAAAESPEHERAPARLGERFTIVVLAAMAAALAFVRFQLLPQQETAKPLAFEFRNPMLDARPDERVLFFQADDVTNQSCAVVRPEGLVLRPNRGPEHIGSQQGLRTGLPYLACSIHAATRGPDVCGGRETDIVLYGLNRFGMPVDTQVRVDSIRPRWMRWGERELTVYEVVFERFGALGGRWTTYLAEEAPVTGLVKWSSLLPHRTTVVYREILEPGR